MRHNVFFIAISIFGLCSMSACQKLVSVPPPVGDLVVTQVFSKDEEATSASAGMYSSMINTYLGYASSGVSVFAGMSSDELIAFDQNYYDQSVQFQDNNLTSSNGYVNASFWTQAYSTIYQANAIMEGLSATTGVHDSVKNELIGEAKFVRAFCNFYLVNLFGDIPLVTTINYQQTGLLSRTATTQVYESIVSDLKDAQSRLPSDYSVGKGQRIIPNKYAATALLARVYLYTDNWQDAQVQSTAIINNASYFSLVPDLNQVFLTNSMEAIWQLQQDNATPPWFNITPEGDLLIPAILNSDYNPPVAYLTPSLLSAFEQGDMRRANWVDSTLYQGTLYRFPFKYQQGPSAIQTNAPYIEYYMVLRLAEQFLIRAEAEAQTGQNSSAILDLDTIRSRAGLPGYQGSADKDSLLQAIYHERQVELFVEWGHRWLDLKRTNQAVSILSEDKGYQVTNNMLVYPIPISELKTDPNLVQNPGY